MTKRLGELADKACNEGKTLTVPAYIDGPYGEPPNLGESSTCILFAGGSGVTYTLPLLQDIVRSVLNISVPGYPLTHSCF
jgi:ferric-chelate reductase